MTQKPMVLFTIVAWMLMLYLFAGKDASRAPTILADSSLPATCRSGSAIEAAEMIVVNPLVDICGSTKTAALVGPEANISANLMRTDDNFKGPAPWADITASGARAAGRTPTSVGAKILQCIAGSKIVTLGTGANQFQNGDGITLQGCGRSSTMSAPSAPTIRPSIARGMTGTELVVNSPTSSSTYLYKIVARDQAGGLTAPSPATTITTGQASLGLQTATITSASRTNDVATYNTSARTNLVVDSLVDIISGTQFTGWYKVCTKPSGTQFTVCGTPFDTRVPPIQLMDTGTATSSAAGAQVSWYQSNHLSWAKVAGAWSYYVCAERPGDSSFRVIGQTKPTSPETGFQDTQYDDYGATYHQQQRYPYYVTDSICTGSATNDPLTSTILSGGGTNTIMLQDNAQQNNTSGLAELDACPALKAAATIAASNPGLGGVVYIPPTPSSGNGFVINSFCKLPAQFSVKQSGGLILGETLEIQGSTNWDGSFGVQGTPQFGTNGGAWIQDYWASPGIELHGQGIHMQYVNTYSSNNGDTLIVADNTYGLTMRNVNLVSDSQASTDYLGMDLVLRDTGGTVSQFVFEGGSFNGGPDQVTDKSWTPLVWYPQGQNGSGSLQSETIYTTLNHVNFAIRGLDMDCTPGCSPLHTQFVYRQGGITPFFSQVFGAQNQSWTFEDTYQDTEGQPMIANLSSANGGYYGIYYIRVANGGVVNPLITGNRPVGVVVNGYFFATGADATPSIGVDKSGYWYAVLYPFDTTGSYTGSAEPMHSFSEAVHIPSGHSMFWDMAPPGTITVSVVRGGEVPISANGWVYTVDATGPDGGATVPNPRPSAPCITSRENRTCKVSWTASLGAVSYDVWRCNTSAGACEQDGILHGVGGWYRIALHIAAGCSICTYSDTAASNNGINTMPAVTGTGVSGMNNKLAWAPQMILDPVTVSALPSASANPGAMQQVTDSTPISAEGQNCVGGSINRALAFSNGSVWKCF